MAQITLGGSVGVPGSVSVLGNYNVVFASDANHTMTPTEFSNKFLNVTGSISTTRNLVAPLNQGQEFVIQNNTTGGHVIVVNGITGAGVSIANGATASVVCDGANYIQAGGNAVSLQGYPVSATAPTTNYVLTWNGATWQPAAGGGGGSFTPGEDLSGNSTSQEVIGILGNLLPSVSGIMLGSGFLNWSGSAWQYSNVSHFVTMGVDITGPADSAAVVAAQGGLISFNPSLSTPNVGGIQFFSTVIGPKIFQNTITANSVNANPMYISAQSATGLNSNGGRLVLTSGSGGTGIGVPGVVSLQIAGTTKLNIGNTGIITLASLSGFGSGLVATDNSGNLSWTSSINWAGDLLGSTNAAQYVSSISGNADGYGNVPINAASLLFSTSVSSGEFGQSDFPTISSGTGADGYTLIVGSQDGQNTTDIAGFGGAGGNLNLSAGNGGTGGAGNGSPGRAAIISGSNHIYLNNAGVVTNTGLTLKSISISSATTYVVDSGSTLDYYIMCATQSNAITITLPLATNGRTLVIKDVSGNAATHNIVINRSGSQHIDGATSYTINTNYGSITLSGSGAESVDWFVVGEYNGTII